LFTAPPISLPSSKKLALIGLFVALALASDFALTPIANVKLVFVLVFVSAYVFGFRIGAYVAVISELIWGIFSPFGFGGLIIPFTVGGTLIYSMAGWAAAKMLGGVSLVSARNFFLGAVMAICAFLWDAETNLATALIIKWPPTIALILGTELAGIPFMVTHELSDFVLGTFLAPVAIVYFARTFGGRGKEQPAETTTTSKIPAGERQYAGER
jgi:hypothetical protein